MKFVIVLAALIAFTAAQGGHRPGFDHGDPLHHLIHVEVMEIMQNNKGITVKDCTTKCDALFDLAAGHDEDMTDRICHEECAHQISGEGHHDHIHPSHPPHGGN